MKRYPKYKESGASWLGQVPEHWELGRLGSCVSLRGEKGSDKDFEPLSVTKNGVVLQLETAAKTDDGDNRKIVRKGDIAINGRSDRKGSSGLAEIDGSVSLINIILKIDRGLCPKFAHHLIRSVAFQEEFYRWGRGIVADLWSTNYWDLKRIPTALPPIGEQQLIANFIDATLAKMDSAISSQERMIELLKERIDSLVLKAISSPLVRSCRIGHIAQLINRPIESNPAGSYVKLGLYNRGRGLFHKDENNQDEMGESDFFYVRPGDLIISGQFAWEGAVAIAGQSEDGCVVSHRYPILRGLSGVAETEYLLAFLCTEYGNFLLNEHSRGAAGRNRPLNIKSLLKEKISLPALEVQTEIVKAVKQRRTILVEINKLNLLLKERRSAIITQAVTGQIDVR